MSTLIVYATRYGCTEKCAHKLKELLEGRVFLHNLKEVKKVDLSRYNKVIIGGSIYMGKIRKEIDSFCQENFRVLKNKKLGLFICCMRKGDIAEEELTDSFPEELLNNALVKDYFGGEFKLAKMNFLERFIVRKMAGIDTDITNILEDKIESFAQKINMA